MGQIDPVQIVVTVLQGQNRTEVLVCGGENLLLALARAGLPIDFFCTTGKCATCRLRMEIPEGSAAPPSATEQYRLGYEALHKGFRLTCQVYVTGPLTVYLDTSE